MPVLVNIRETEEGEARLRGQVSLKEMGISISDELIRSALPLEYDLLAQDAGGGLLVRGVVSLALNCECARCLRPFVHRLTFANWTCHIPLAGEKRLGREEGFVDLTPYLREDILLELPQNPVCGRGCVGLLQQAAEKSATNDGGRGSSGEQSGPWAALNKLKF